MKNALSTEAPCTLSILALKREALCWLMALCVWATASGCGPAEPLAGPVPLESASQELDSANGLSLNGLSANGLSLNGLSANGLSANGLVNSAFTQWFTLDRTLANMVMSYVVRCAVPEGQTRSYTDAETGTTYTWTGGLGLAQNWANGNPANSDEQQLVTACLLAHVNQAGRHVSISVLGWNAWGNAIPFSSAELTEYPVREACFFGNLFTSNSLFFGVDQPINTEGEYHTRACGAPVSGSGPANQCAPLQFAGRCADICTLGTEPSFYSNCTVNGVSYRPITTRMMQADFDALLAATGT
jgi:hypothetical protein